jgi:Tfp pilus assembly protein PilF
VDPSQIQAEAERVVASRSLRPSQHLVRLLRFLVAETLAGRGSRLKEYVLGTEVFDRGQEFDPQIDTIVRVQVRRLRSKLDEYYRDEGAADAVRIRVNPGSYVPIFEARMTSLEPDARAAALRPADRLPRKSRGFFLAVAGLGTLAVVGSIAVWRIAGGPAGEPASPVSRPNSPVVNGAAHALYLRAKAAYAVGSRDALHESEGLFEQALQIDPRYAPAHAGLAYTYLIESSNFAAPADVMPKARAAARAALALDESLVEAHTALGTVALFYDWDMRAASASIDRALALNSRSSTAHELRAEMLMAGGRFDDALAEIQLAQQADPLSAALEYDAGWILIGARRYVESAAASRRALARDPGFALARGVLGLALILDGQSSGGLRELEAASAEGDSAILDLMLVHGYALTHQVEAARTILTRVEASAGHRYVCSYEVGSAYAALENPDRAFEWLHHAVTQRSDCIVWLRVEPWLDRLRADPRFAMLVSEIAVVSHQ